MSKKLTLQEKACKVIEWLMYDDLEMRTLHGFDRDPITTEEAEILQHKLGSIYMFTHVAVNPPCIKSHDDWVEELEKTYKRFRKNGYFKRGDVNGSVQNRTKSTTSV